MLNVSFFFHISANKWNRKFLSKVKELLFFILLVEETTKNEQVP